ncbi:hypothetical protein PQX77_005235 [Marasmius sp. AFHP31]|nr:hypothetical protein PQX77_005235 [Marasmius sp. AFHP31]
MLPEATGYKTNISLTVLLRWLNGRPPLPPGPKNLPIVGPLFDLAKRKDDLRVTYFNWSKVYGDVFHFSIFGHHTIVLNSSKAMFELLDKRSSNYSDRPDMPMVKDLMEWNWATSLMRYSDWWRIHRRTFHQYFQPRAISDYYPVQRTATADLMSNLAESPEHFHEHVRFASDSAILQIAYGYSLKRKDDPYIGLVERAGSSVLAAHNHGTFWVDYFPSLKYVPSWLPGAGFRRKAKVWAGYSRDLVESPWDWLKGSIENRTAPPSFSTRSLERLSVNAGDGSFMEGVIKNCAAFAYLGAAETTPAAILTFILAMVVNPEAQARAQAEIDEAFGLSGLPELHDRDRLPFVNAVIAETLRWNPVAPLVVPHRALNDDIYDRWFIPAGATIVPNVWAVLCDETVYGPNTKDFDPERFMKQDGKELPPDPELFVFGFGRRICPGRYFAMDTLFLVVTHLLATFTLAKPLNDNGEEVSPKVEWVEGSVSCAHSIHSM